jgi:5-methylthioribose kinase
MGAIASADETLLRNFLVENGLLPAGGAMRATALGGGVSCDIWRVDLDRGAVCVKRALAKLRVAADWRAPVARNATEWAWFETVGRILPGAVPKLIAHDSARGLFAMEYLPPETHPLWKAQLLAGHVDVEFAGTVGDTLGQIHAATAGEAAIAACFRKDEAFHALRIEPYLLATGAKHPGLQPHFEALAARTFATHLALVHGDISPKNILIGPKGPVFLDAETACYGDPSFDLAFCLNHLLLKALVRPGEGAALAASFDALGNAWLAHVDWEMRAEAEMRAATLLPALMLARVDGKSPVEYLTPPQQDRVRMFATARLQDGGDSLKGFYAAWRAALTG